MRVIRDFGSVRVISTGENPMHAHSNIFVQKIEGGAWRNLAGFNSLSNDYAYTSADERAQEEVAKHEKKNSLGLAPTTCIEHAYGSTTRLSFQIKVF